jgi:hypothetical protein
VCRNKWHEDSYLVVTIVKGIDKEAVFREDVIYDEWSRCIRRFRKANNVEPVTLIVDQIQRDLIVHDSQELTDLGLYIYTFGMVGE